MTGSDAPRVADGRDPRVRTARTGDSAAVERLQDHLRDPSPELLAYGLAMGDVLVSTDEADHPVGYLLPVHGPAELHLGEMAIDPEFRREGRARGLMTTAIDMADGPVTLLVAPENAAARSLYDELGFENVARREDAYPDGDALVYRYEPA